MVIHMGAQSNLYAALAWTLVNLLGAPALLDRVRGGDDVLLEQCANESIRMAQRSITLRYVMSPLDFDDGQRTYRLGSGVMITTMLPVNNTSAAPGLERFDPAHYDGRRLAAGVALPARELVSTFGHGRHACPAQRFAISAIRIAVRGPGRQLRADPALHRRPAPPPADRRRRARRRALPGRRSRRRPG